MKNTSIHSQSNLQPENYVIVDMFDSQEPQNIERGYTDENGLSPARGSDAEKMMIAEIRAFHDKMESLFGTREIKCTCDHCGKSTRYFAVAKHTPTNTHIAVGETCSINSFGISNKAYEFKSLRENAQRIKTRIERDNALANLATTDSELFNVITKLNAQIKNHKETVDQIATELDATSTAQREVVLVNVNRSLNFMDSVIGSIRERNYVASEKQRAIILCGITRGVEFAKMAVERVKAKEGFEIIKASLPVLVDRVEVSGKFVSTKKVESSFGYHTTYTTKGLFQCDAGQKIWMTVSNKIQDSVEGGEVINVPMKLVVTVERSDKDASFYFGKRPVIAK